MAYKDDTTFLGIRLDSALKVAIERLADAEDRSVSNWVQRALAAEVKRQEAKGA